MAAGLGPVTGTAPATAIGELTGVQKTYRRPVGRGRGIASLPDDFPVAIPLGTLIGLLVLTLLVIRLPLRRASRIQPRLALRYH
jgi:ABC-type lipoprotein release transport system permease subunit